MQNKPLIKLFKDNAASFTAGFLFFVLFILETALHPSISVFIEKQIKTELKKLKIDVEFSSVDYGYIPPNLSLKKVSFQDDTTIASADRVNLSLRVLPLLSGQIKAGHLIIDKLNASLKPKFSRQDSTPKTKIDLDLSKISKLIPVEYVLLSNSKLIIIQNNDVFDFDFEFLEFEKLFGKLQIEVKAKTSIRTKNFKDSFLLNSKMRWQEKGFFISFFTIQKKNSILQTSGFLNKEILKSKTVNATTLFENVTELRVSLNADLEEFSPLLSKYVPAKVLKKSQVKDFSGRVQASGYYFPKAHTETSTESGSIKIKADNISSPFVTIESIELDGKIDSETFTSENLNLIFNEQSSLSLNNILLKKESESYSISVDLDSKRVHIEDVIKSLNLQADNLKTPVSLKSHCGGSFHKKILLKCTGMGRVESFDILNSKSKEPLISTKDLSTQFTAFIRQDSMSFDANLKYKDETSHLESSGFARGDVDYIKGFNVDFESSPIDLNFINTISGLKFYGQTALKGSTKGSSRWGTFKADLKNKNFKLNQFFLGDSTSNLEYNFPLLSVRNIEGRILEYGNTYSGDLSLNVSENSLNTDFLGQNINDQGVRALFLDQFQLPLDIKFQSNLIINAGGSTDINLMDLNLKTKASELDLFGESFESATIELSGKAGNWRVEKGVFAKKNSSLSTRGTFEGIKNMDVRLISNNLKFEDSTFLKNLGVKLSGPLELTLNAKGPIDGPEAVGTLVSNNTLGPSKNNLGSSSIGYRMFENELFFKGDVFRNSFVGEGLYPLKPEGQLSLKGEFQNFDTLNFLTFNADNTKNTHLYINGKADFLRKKNRAFTGEIQNFKATLSTDQKPLLKINQTGSGSLSAPISFKTIQQEDEASINFDLSKATKKTMDFSGSLDIAFLQPLIPTCEFIGGKLKSDQLRWSRSSGVASSSGTARLVSANFKSDAFPYSFSKIQALLQARKNKIFISDLTAFLSNTKVYGNGQIQTSRPASIDLNVKHKDLKLEFPQKIFTTTNGAFNLSGNTIPLDVTGKLVVTEGVFATELIGNDSTQTVLPNKRLPTKILRNSAPPANLKNVLVTIRERMKVINSEAEGFASGSLTANGNPADPTVKGKIKLKPGFKINFQDNAFIVKEGTVEYKNKSIESPDLFIDAATNKITDNNDPLERSYVIRMLADGAPTDLDIDFTSQPSLDEKQIVSLLTIGTVSTQSLGQEINAQEQATYSGFQFGSYLLQRNKAVKDLKKKTGIELGVSSSLTSFGVSPKVEAKKGWTPKLSSSLSQTFGNQRNLEFKNEYKLNKKTSTVLGVQNNQTSDASQLNSRQIRQGLIFDLGLQYKFEFD